MLCDLLWSDPEADISGWAENDRGVSYTFGADVVTKFLQKHDYDLVVRAHQVVEDGFEFFADRQLVTLFSAPNYCGEFDNAGAVMSVDEDLMCSFRILKPAEKAKFGFGSRPLTPPRKTFIASRGRTTHAELRTFVLTPAPPAWELLPALNAQLHMNKKVIDVASIMSSGPLETMFVGSGTAVRGLFSSSSDPSASKAIAGLFSWGGKASGEASGERATLDRACALIHASVLVPPVVAGVDHLTQTPADDVAAGSGGGYGGGSGGSGGSSATWQPCVFKDFKSKDAKDHLLERYLEEMEVNSVASALAAEFNRTQRPPADRQMRYVLSSVATVETAKGSRTYFAEPFLEGSFTRFSYNTGPWEEDRLDPWLLRFALWTYE
eukprot:jgi/Chrpa1/23979/Chrysochromulina_OHIO_Genome00025945-RA